MALMPGAVIEDRYRIVRALSTGGMGAVYEAIDLNLDNTTVALKEMLPDASHPDLVKRKFHDEMAILSKLRHPAIPRILQTFTHDETIYLAMDYVRGRNLLELLQNGPMSLDQATDIAVQVLDALIYLHSQVPPIVHRDVKPANIMVEEGSGKVYLVDFGFARMVETATSAPTQTLVATLGYAPLEQLQGKAEPRTDIYSLGATLNHLVTGVESSPMDVKPLIDNKRINPAFARLVDRACASKVEDRYPTALAMRDALQKWHLPPTPVMPVISPRHAALELPPTEIARFRPMDDASRRPLPLIIGGVVVAVLLVVGGLLLARARMQSPSPDASSSPGSSATPVVEWTDLPVPADGRLALPPSMRVGVTVPDGFHARFRQVDDATCQVNLNGHDGRRIVMYTTTIKSRVEPEHWVIHSWKSAGWQEKDHGNQQAVFSGASDRDAMLMNVQWDSREDAQQMRRIWEVRANVPLGKEADLPALLEQGNKAIQPQPN